MLDRNLLVNRLWRSLEENGYQRILDSKSQNRFTKQMLHSDVTIEEYNTLAHYAQNDDQECLELLLLYSTRMIYKQTMKFSTRFEYNSNDDLMQAGFLGLLKAIPGWDKNKGSFKTYSHYYIRMTIIEEVRRIDNIISIKNEDKATLIRKLPDLWVSYKKTETKDFSKKGFVDWLKANDHINKNIGNFTVRDLNIIEQLTNIQSLDYTILSKDSDDVTLLDIVEDDISNNPESRALENERSRMIRERLDVFLDVLTDKQRLVFCIYNGIEKLTDREKEIIGDRRMTFKIVAEILRYRYPDATWHEINCNELHSRAWKKINEYKDQNNLTIDIE